MELTVQERLVIAGLFQNEGSVVYLRAARDINNKVGLTADELQKYGVEQFTDEGGAPRLRWKLDVPQERDVKLTGGEKALIAEELKKLDKEEKLLSEQLSLYEKFVE